LVAPGGYLLTLVFPIDGDREDGPPFSVDVAAYEASLGEGWEKVLDYDPATVAKGLEGKQKMAVWKRAA